MMTWPNASLLAQAQDFEILLLIAARLSGKQVEKQRGELSKYRVEHA